MTIQLVCTVSESTDVPREMVFAQPIRIQVDHVPLCRELWRELHAEQNADPEWFESWCKRVPSFGCGCRKWLREWLKNNPPVYGEGWYEWTYNLHDAVNAKLGKPLWDRTIRFD